MKLEIKVPSVGESVTQADIESWEVSTGDFVKKAQVLAVLETDKASMEIPSPEDGVITILKEASSTVSVDEVIAHLDTSKTAGKSQSAASVPSAEKPAPKKPVETVTAAPKSVSPATTKKILSPAAKRVAGENSMDITTVQGTGKDGRITKEDLLNALQMIDPKSTVKTFPSKGQRKEKMTNLRRRTAERLVQSQHTTATLSTFNEVDMSRIMEIRKLYQEKFVKTHGVKLGFMSFFVKAVVSGLKQYPKINAFIEGENIVYNDFYNVGVAVGTDKGLVVPVIFDADELSLAAIEKKLIEYKDKALGRKLSPDDLTGGTFTISNGGVFGSLLSTPILNPPQSGILGMHKIEQRPVVIDGKIEIKPMMYLTLSYDHRIVDGKESVSFLVKVKEALEEPASLLIDL